MEVADRAGVSMKTVSRVMNNELHVRPAMRDRVLAAMAELQYHPNLAARQLAGNRSFTLAIITYEGHTSYLSRIALAVATECRRFGYHLISETFNPDERSEDVIRRILTNSRPEGIIVPAPHCNEPDIVASIERSGTPLVRLAGTGDGYGIKIEVHEHDVSVELVRHLIALGHRRIALIASPFTHGAANERTIGYHTAMAEAGIAVDPELVVDGDFSFASGATIGRALLEHAAPPTAIFAANDGMALGVLAAARQMGLSVPRDVAIAGFDDSPAGRMVFPPITTVRQPLQDMARAAVLALIGKDDETVELSHTLLVRGSTSGDESLILDEIDL